MRTRRRIRITHRIRLSVRITLLRRVRRTRRQRATTLRLLGRRRILRLQLRGKRHTPRLQLRGRSRVLQPLTSISLNGIATNLLRVRLSLNRTVARHVRRNRRMQPRLLAMRWSVRQRRLRHVRWPLPHSMLRPRTLKPRMQSRTPRLLRMQRLHMLRLPTGSRCTLSRTTLTRW